MPRSIRNKFEKLYPAYAHIFREIPVVERLSPLVASVPDAVLRVVVGQMLSTASARTIHQRICTLAESEGTEPWKLTNCQLRACGLSNSKCRTIKEFRDRYLAERDRYDRWNKLDQDTLQSEIVAHWGMSIWTASILSLFYFAHEDVFPAGDGSLVRALDAMHAKASVDRELNERIDPALASPHRSYLAMYLWRALDSGIV